MDPTSQHGTAAWPAWRQATLYAAVAGAHVGTIALARHIARTTTEGVPLWAAAGVTVAVLVLAPRSLWPGILAATFVANTGSNLVIDLNLTTSSMSALANCVEPLLGAAIVLRVLGTRPNLSDRDHLLAYLAGAVVAAPVVGAVLGAFSTQLSPDPLPYLDVARRWFVGDALGVLVIGSLILAWTQPADEDPAQHHAPIEVLAVAVAVIGLTAFAFFGTSPVLAYIVIPPLGWASIRFGARGATVSGLAIAVIADWATIEEHGLFARLAAAENNEALFALQIFLAVILVTGLVLAAHVSALSGAQRALLAAEERQRLSSLLESSPDPILVLRRDSTVVHVNEQVLAITGRTREELTGRPFVDQVRPEYRAVVLDRLATIVAQPAGTRLTYEMVGLSDVINRPLEVAVSPLDTLEGRVVVATVRDVTERKEHEAVLRAAVASAEAATKARTEFLATMSHEIRTPMSAVTSLIELLGHTPLDDEQQSLLSTMRSSSAALLRIIDDTLDFSKIEAGMLEFEALPVSIDDELRTVASLMEPAATTKSIDLTCSVEPLDPPVVLSDPVRMRQILLNLVSNAIKFTSEGGVELSAMVSEPDGEGSVDVRFTIRDTGIGIAPEHRATLFRPYTQAEHSTTRLYGGTGLGLSIVARLIALMGGEIDVESSPGAGSTFTVQLRLPAAPPDARPRLRPSRPEPSTVDHDRIGGHVVLVAEDNQVNRDVLRRQLALLGCACEVVTDGQEALDRLERGGISLVLTDCNMPVIDGFELTRRIRAAERDRGAPSRMPVVAITANALDGEGDRCLAADMDAYLTKPVDAGRLAGALAELLPTERPRDHAVDLGVLRAIVGGDDAEVVDVFRTALSAIHESLAEIDQALERGEGAATKQPAHRVAGAAVSVGANRLATLARMVEVGATTSDVEALASTAAWMHTELELVGREVAQLGVGRG